MDRLSNIRRSSEDLHRAFELAYYRLGGRLNVIDEFSTFIVMCAWSYAIPAAN
jgi:hypothetical protein